MSLLYGQIFPSVFDFSLHYNDILKTFVLRAILLFFLCVSSAVGLIPASLLPEPTHCSG